MFKKNASVVTSRVLSGKDVKKLRLDAATACPGLSDVALDALVPPKASVSHQKLANRAVVYSIADGEPLFFEVHDHLFPTVYTLWRYTSALPSITTYSEVSPKVLGGADLFLAGVIVPPEGLPHFAAGQPMALRVPGHPYPFAVGVMECSSAEAQANGMKGRGLKLLHTYTDLLWGMGPGTVPHPSFTPARIFPHDSPEHQADSDATSATAAVDGMQYLSISDAQPSAAASEPAAAAQTSAVAAGAGTQAAAGAAADANGTTPDDGSSSAHPLQTAAAPAVDISNPDAVAVHCLLAGCHSVGDGDLPIMTSDFQSKHMLPNLPEGATLDLKKTSFKKLAKLLSMHEKKGLLTQKLVHKQDHIAAINRAHALYTAFAPAAQDAAPAAPAPAGKGATPKAGLATITVCTAYKASSSLQPVLGSDAPRDKLYTAVEVEAALRQYAAGSGLAASPDAAQMALDRLLIGALYNKSEQPAEGSSAETAEVLRRLLGKLQLWSRIRRTTQQEEKETLQKGSPKNVQVQLEDRAGGRKHITRLSGMEAFGIDPDELATALQRRFQSSASVTKLPGKTETGKEIALQGDQLQNAAQFLTDVYGLPHSYITSKNRSKG